MLIDGWVWLGAREPGAPGFSNEKSLTYWPSTLSAGGCCGASVGAAGPPLVVVMNAYLRPNGLAHDRRPRSAAWLTYGQESHKLRATRFRPPSWSDKVGDGEDGAAGQGVRARRGSLSASRGR